MNLTYTLTFYLIVFTIIAFGTLLMYYVSDFIFRPMKNRKINSTDTMYHQRERQRISRMARIRTRVSRVRPYDFRLKFMEGTIKDKLDMLQYHRTLEEVLYKQYIILGIGFITHIPIIIFLPFVAIVTLPMIIMISNMEIRKLDKLIEKRNKHIDNEFGRFYNRMYYLYNREVNTPLVEAIQAFSQNTTKEMKRELEVFINMIYELGELRALREWKDRIRTPYVVKFCDVMDARLNERLDSGTLMLNFKQELEITIEENKQRVLRRETAKGRALQFIFFADIVGLAILVLLVAFRGVFI